MGYGGDYYEIYLPNKPQMRMGMFYSFFMQLQSRQLFYSDKDLYDQKWSWNLFMDYYKGEYYQKSWENILVKGEKSYRQKNPNASDLFYSKKLQEGTISCSVGII